MKQLFRLSSEVLDALTIKEMKSTLIDMMEMGIADVPYKEFAIEVNRKFISKMMNLEDEDSQLQMIESAKKMKIEYDPNIQFKLMVIVNGKNYSIHRCYKDEWIDWDYDLLIKYKSHLLDKASYDRLRNQVKSISANILGILIVLLATKNHVKEDRVDKDIARGRYNKKQAYRKDYPITTTISIGKITETYEGKGGTGSKKRPHMRRGHIRTQHYGPNRELTQKIFIQPVFVNADEGWIAKRRAYNVGA